jgi:hypothetical protein
MTRDVIFGLATLSLALLACGGPSRPAEAEGNDIVGIVKKDFGSDAYNMPSTFARLSRKHGCNVKENADAAVSNCNAGTIVLMRDGTTILVACKAISEQQCTSLFASIVAEGKR